jgi:hypothetical protein
MPQEGKSAMSMPSIRLQRSQAGALLLAACGLASAAAPAAKPPANDFPTVDRVLYVQECMRAHPGPAFEMTSKCACTLDQVAASLKYQEYVTMSTIVKAMSIGGERGGQIRDVPSYEPQVKRYKELVSKAEKACFIGPEPR